jgi:hypothetical protein
MGKMAPASSLLGRCDIIKLLPGHPGFAEKAGAQGLVRQAIEAADKLGFDRAAGMD